MRVDVEMEDIMPGDRRSPRTLVPRLASKEGRWMRLGPWFAMFPVEFACNSIHELCAPGGAVLDPFCGRGTAIYCAAVLGRRGYGVEIDAIAWIYATTKLAPAPLAEVLWRLESLSARAMDHSADPPNEFFRWAFHPDVFRFLDVARAELNWRASPVDRTVMALILVNLHGKSGDGLSNQMRQTKSMAPDYAVRWWRERRMRPMPLDHVTYLKKRISWRYRYGAPSLGAVATVLHGDSTSCLSAAAARGPYDLLLTSPPYLGVVNYNYDQWLRRWMVGGPPHPTRSAGPWQGRFESRSQYTELLTTVFLECRPLLSPAALLCVRTDARDYTLRTTTRILREIFPDKAVEMRAQPISGKTQTALFGDRSSKPGEVDLIFRPRRTRLRQRAYANVRLAKQAAR